MLNRKRYSARWWLPCSQPRRCSSPPPAPMWSPTQPGRKVIVRDYEVSRRVERLRCGVTGTFVWFAAAVVGAVRSVCSAGIGAVGSRYVLRRRWQSHIARYDRGSGQPSGNSVSQVIMQISLSKSAWSGLQRCPGVQKTQTGSSSESSSVASSATCAT